MTGNRTGGVFIAVEGPNGVGKTTAAAALTIHLKAMGVAVLPTTEPSGTPLGRLIREGEAELSGRTLALAIAADRAAHLARDIEPALAAGRHVVSDRYLPSSLVLQRLDGLSTAEIWRYNSWAAPPDVTFYLEHDPAAIRCRLNERRHHSRLERLGSPERELALYAEAYDFLTGYGWRQIRVDCRGLTPADVAAVMLDHLDLQSV
ncbi:dTMP kinase [Thermoactinospora rubra]|uniref:dTMP kinase n=1 Tax=Thermoactinospora rubra TaxID=1088767 RepID=UPI0013019D78|nr:dTMP kinase [Thermoactinospora rubra]